MIRAATIYKHPNENYTYWATNACFLACACVYVCIPADDTRITRPVPTREQAYYLQRDLVKIYSWATSGIVSFNNDKFRVLHYNVPGGEPREERMYQSHDG